MSPVDRWNSRKSHWWLEDQKHICQQILFENHASNSFQSCVWIQHHLHRVHGNVVVVCHCHVAVLVLISIPFTLKVIGKVDSDKVEWRPGKYWSRDITKPDVILFNFPLTHGPFSPFPCNPFQCDLRCRCSCLLLFIPRQEPARWIYHLHNWFVVFMMTCLTDPKEHYQ